MNTKEISFVINKNKKIVLRSQDPFDEISCCYDGCIFLAQQEHTILLSNDDILDNMRVFAALLGKALNNSLSLHSSLSKDIGYVYNQYSHFLWSDNSSEIDHFFYEYENKKNDWIGMRYHLWAAQNNVTWLYNNENGEIILEITPFYPYLHTNPSEEPQYIFFEEWVKTYQPYFKIIVSKNIAQLWLEQANQVIQQIYANIERLKKEYEK